MRCEDAVGLIVDSLMDRLSADQQQDLDEHLATCSDCALEAERLAEVWSMLGELPAFHEAGGSVGSALRIGAKLGEPTASERVSDTRSAWPGSSWRAAAAVVVLLATGVTGYVLGIRSSAQRVAETGVSGPAPTSPDGQASPEGATFLLLARGGEPDATMDGAALVAEYSAWAEDLAGQGRLSGANKLFDEPGRWVSGAAAPYPRTSSDVQGYFLIRAASYDEAVDIAMASPHIRYGGTFEVRQVEETN